VRVISGIFRLSRVLPAAFWKEPVCGIDTTFGNVDSNAELEIIIVLRLIILVEVIVRLKGHVIYGKRGLAGLRRLADLTGEVALRLSPFVLPLGSGYLVGVPGNILLPLFRWWLECEAEETVLV
jgi:hypothetical protein